tara:strand:+ start:23 stop:598 length:576 start_codon:yes stop_codon:yes gene_type:complete
MKATEVLKKAKELLSIETEEVKLAQATLENGTVIEAEQMAEGQEVFIVTDDEKVALPVGEYTLEDGQILMVKEEGIIASIGAAKEEEPAEEDLSEEQKLEEEKEEMKYATKEELSEVKQMIEEIKAMIDKKEEMASEVVEEEKVEEPKEELSAVPKVKHNPEKETEKQTYLFSQKSGTTTLDRVLSKISNN